MSRGSHRSPMTTTTQRYDEEMESYSNAGIEDDIYTSESSKIPRAWVRGGGGRGKFCATAYIAGFYTVRLGMIRHMGQI